MSKGTRKGLIFGTSLSLGLFAFTEVVTLAKLGEGFQLIDLVMFLLYWSVCSPLMIMTYNQDERAKLQEANNLLEGEYEVTYTLKCTYKRHALNSEDALSSAKPFSDMTSEEVRVLEFKSKYVGDDNEMG